VEPRIREVVSAERRRRFVGRTAELTLFAAALAADRPPFAVLHVNGVGGVGKSALLRMFVEQAAAASRAVTLVDGHHVQPNRSSFVAALGVARVHEPLVVLVDSYELLDSLDSWLREQFVADLPEGSIVVLASRRGPAGWRDDPGWRGLSRTLKLDNLSPVDSAAYLVEAGAPEGIRESVVARTGGHPLALGLAVDLLAGRDIGHLDELLRAAPDVLATLTTRLLDTAPDNLHRVALAACAVARFTTEASLRAALQHDDVRQVFEWLRDLSCIEQGPRGLYPHDLARDVLEADLRWRDEALYWQLWQRTRAHIQLEIRTTHGASRREYIFDLVFTTRTDPVSRRYWRWETFGAAAPEPASPVDRTALLDIIEAHEGPESRRLLGEWWDRQPEAFTIYRRHGEVAGMAAWLTLTAATDQDPPSDPVIAAVRAHIKRYGPLTPGDEVIVRRFLADRDVYQDPSPAVDLSMIAHFEYVASRPRLTWIIMTVADPDFWTPQFAGINFRRVADTNLGVNGSPMTVFARDTREPSPIFDPVRATPEPASATTLSRTDFDEAVRDALRNIGRIATLQTSPLLTLRQVRERGGGPDALRAVLTETAALMRDHPRDVKQYRAVDRTYLRPAPTQERAAQLLGLPFTTYRRHLTQGVATIAETLWQRDQAHG
jgi:hypothetical protein